MRPPNRLQRYLGPRLISAAAQHVLRHPGSFAWQTLKAFKANQVLCVNTLTAKQEALSPLFAGQVEASMDERFGAAAWTVLATGSPVLAGAVVSFDCRIAQVTEVGTHSVFFCAVEAIQSGAAREGLIYFGRSYHRVPGAAA